ncbi:phosphatase inhibitor-domain-containing protein [Kalaharituber pfeilii]|nr:phosphatase inhibitor-domain-containing protein [Kalaharituber pfeilii]
MTPSDYLTMPTPTTSTIPIPTTYSTRTQLEASSSEGESTPSPPRMPDGTLRLRGGPVQERRVTWGEDVIDNEGLGRKKSKGMQTRHPCTFCCIFRPTRPFGESSSDESSSSDSDSDLDYNSSADNGRARPVGGSKGCGGNHHHHAHGQGHGRKSRRGPKRPPSPNAYEKMPKAQRKGV